MASEATITQVNNLSYRQVKCSDGSAWAKGTRMIFAGTDGTVDAQANAQDKKVAGILAVEKVASDGQTTVPVLVHGTATVFAGDTNVVAGDYIIPASLANSYRALGAASIEKVGSFCGFAESAGNAGGTFKIRLNLG